MNTTGMLTIVETAYHTPTRGEAKANDCSFSINLTTDDPVYVRPGLLIDETPTPLDCGWVKDPLMFIIENTGEKRLVNPSVKEAEADAMHVIEIALGGGCFLLPPGHSFRGMPDDFNRVRLRCRKGSVKVQVTIFPK